MVLLHEGVERLGGSSEQLLSQSGVCGRAALGKLGFLELSFRGWGQRWQK